MLPAPLLGLSPDAASPVPLHGGNRLFPRPMTAQSLNSPVDSMQLLQFLSRAVPEHEVRPMLQYEERPPLRVPLPPAPAPPPPLKHHRKPEPEYAPLKERPNTARTRAAAHKAPPIRPQSARTAHTGKMVFLPAAINDAMPTSSSVAEAVAAAADRAMRGELAAPEATSARGATWEPIARRWSDWSVSNGAYPTLEERPEGAVKQAAARHRYAIHATADDAQRQSRWRPSAAPVRVKRQFPDRALGAGAGMVPHPPGPRDSGVRFGAGPRGGQLQFGAGAEGGLGALLGGRKGSSGGPKISLKTTMLMARRLSAGQSRARAKEQERLKAEHEAHLHSLRTALGTLVDPAAPGGCSTASAIEATMEEELRLAIPPPRDRSPLQLGRTIDKLEVRLVKEALQSHSDRRPARKPYMRETSSRRTVTTYDGRDTPSSPERERPKPIARSGSGRSVTSFASSRSLATPASSRPQTASSDGRGDSASPPFFGKARSSGDSPLVIPAALQKSIAEGKMLSADELTQLKSVVPAHLQRKLAEGKMLSTDELAQLKSQTRPPSSSTRKPTYGVGPMGGWGEDDGEQLEALPMPLPGGSARRRGRSPTRLASPGRPFSALNSAKEHTLALQYALELCSPILKRESLRIMIARILDNPELLPLGEHEYDEAADGEEDA